MRARDIMTSNPLVVTGEDTISHAAEIMREAEVGIVPVVDDREHRRLIGVITDRDIAVRCVSHKHVPACDVRLHMSADHLHTVAPDDDVDRVIEAMAHDQVRRIPVVADDGRLIGMISQADLATNASNLANLAIPCNHTDCPAHLGVRNGQKYVSYDVAAWSDLWFYSNPIYIEVEGSTSVAGVK